MKTALNLLCLRASDPNKLVAFYAKLGLSFHEEKHGSGPLHHSCQLGDAVFEIYPSSENYPSTAGARIGFSVDSIDQALRRFGNDCDVVSKPRDTQWGRCAVIKDPEGHKVELLEATGAHSR